MKLESLSKSSKISLFTVTSLLAVLVCLGTSSVVYASSPTVGFAVPTNSAVQTNALQKYDMTLHFKPNTGTLTSSGGTVDTKLHIDNKGTSSFDVTGCLLKYKLPGSTKYLKGACTLSPAFTVNAGSHVTVGWFFSIGSGAPTGLWTFKVFLTGTVNGVKSESHPAIFKLTVT